MTVERLHIELDITLDKIDSNSYPELLSQEKDYYINEAIARIVKQRYGLNNIYQQGFEQIQKRTEDLKNLVVTKFAALSMLENYSSFGETVYKADLSSLFNDVDLNNVSSDQYMFYIKSLSTICKNNCCVKAKGKLVQQDDLSVLFEDPFNKPTKNKVLFFFEEGNINIATDGSEVESFAVTFIKKPAVVNLGNYGEPKVECDLSEHLHKEIIQEAAMIVIENLESPRIQSQQSNVQKVE